MYYLISIGVVLFSALIYFIRDDYRVKRFKKNAMDGSPCEFLRSGYKVDGFIIDYNPDNVFAMVQDVQQFMCRIPTSDVMPRNSFKFAFKKKPVL